MPGASPSRVAPSAGTLGSSLPTASPRRPNRTRCAGRRHPPKPPPPTPGAFWETTGPRAPLRSSMATAGSAAAAAAEEEGLMHTWRDVFVDAEPGADFVTKQLAATEEFARQRGTVVAIAHPAPTTLAMLERWIPDAKARGFQFLTARDM